MQATLDEFDFGHCEECKSPLCLDYSCPMCDSDNPPFADVIPDPIEIPVNLVPWQEVILCCVMAIGTLVIVGTCVGGALL